ncbi:MAG: SIR2 family protein [Actinobacteria bacterium]|nr:SIR2 family protein [Actinomycetota bacterium]MCG2808559.1 SIR2 family protein [Coriobacteriia bacterium]
MKLQNDSRWVFSAPSDIHISRCSEPRILQLDEAAKWVNTTRPILWVGSIFSVPPPASLPPGYAVTRSLLDLVTPLGTHTEEERQRVVEHLLPRWPLELLLDEFESLHYDLSESLLTFFAELERDASPCCLHHAAVRYYQSGLACAPMCVTTNWDSLLERAFHDAGVEALAYGPSGTSPPIWDDIAAGDSHVHVLHPHGSFEMENVVCSFSQQSGQLQLAPVFMGAPKLFLGYSGYEPSLYRYLELDPGEQLWCIRSEDDFEIPLKRRLLCRPNASVYVGDLVDLLEALGLVDERPDFTTVYVAPSAPVPRRVVDVMLSGIASSIDPVLCVESLPDILLSGHPEPEATFRYSRLIRSIDNHIRDRVSFPGLPLALMAAATSRDYEQLWVSVLAYVLRHTESLPDETTAQLLNYVERSRAGLDADSLSEDSKLSELFRRARTRCYRSFLGMPEKKGDDPTEPVLNFVAPTFLGDTALVGEHAELAAFFVMKAGDLPRAQNYFDNAATYYYLAGLWNGGAACEWASQNIEAARDTAGDTMILRRPTVVP